MFMSFPLSYIYSYIKYTLYMYIYIILRRIYNSIYIIYLHRMYIYVDLLHL